MKKLLIFALLFFPMASNAQASASCQNLTGYADTTVVKECPLLQYVTEALDLSQNPVTIYYQVTPDSCLVHWDGYRFYQSANTPMNRRESMEAYNLVLNNVYPKD